MGAAEPLVSIVLPMHNGERYVAQAIESVLNQRVEPLELIVVDDASTDRSAAIVRGYGDRVRYLCVDKQATSIAVTNIGMRLATGTYVSVIHQDDYLLPGKLQRQAEVMEADPTIGLSYSGQWFVGEYGEPLGRLHSPLRHRDYVVDGATEMWHLGVQNYINYCNVLMRRSALEEVGLFDDPHWVIADWSMWLRLAMRHRVGYIDEALVCYRVHPGAQTLARTQTTDEWAKQVREAMAAIFTDPRLPRRIARRRPLADASLLLNLALFDLYRGNVRRSAGQLGRAATTAGWLRLPSLLYSSAIVPRLLPRARMTWRGWLAATRSSPPAGMIRGQIDALRCRTCGGVSGYPADRTRGLSLTAGPASGGMRCIACGAAWDAPTTIAAA